MKQPFLEYYLVHYILRQLFPGQQPGNGYLICLSYNLVIPKRPSGEVFPIRAEISTSSNQAAPWLCGLVTVIVDLVVSLTAAAVRVQGTGDESSASTSRCNCKNK